MLREFRDKSGVKWRVWDVRPTAPMLDRRLVLRRGGQVESYPGADRRQAERRLVLGAHRSDGWLAFDSVLGRRRLMQIPTRWTEAGEAELCEWCQSANQAEPRLEWGRSAEY
jgi:hypothetical protein